MTRPSEIAIALLAPPPELWYGMVDRFFGIDTRRPPLRYLGRNIRILREMRRITQAGLAERVGVAPAYISQIETLIRMPSLKVMQRIAQALGTSVDTLIGEEPSTLSARPVSYERLHLLKRVVHALEHGHVVVYYDAPGDDVIDTLKDWTRLFGGHWDGLVVVPHRELGQRVVMTAWRKRLDLDSFDAPTAARFIDAYRGRGPERPVR